MSNLIFVCWRDDESAVSEDTLRRVADRITPAGLSEPAHLLATGRKEALCLTGPVGAARAIGTSAHLGSLAGPWEDWHVPGTSVPDGTFALVRSGGSLVEVCSDFAGSRTLWYAQTESRFLVSTSQRALVCLLGKLDLNRTALAWFLSSGSLGPSDAWDQRLRRLPANARLTLDRTQWTLGERAGGVSFQPEPGDESAIRGELSKLLRTSVQRFDFTSAPWALPLSGGYDCRFILGLLAETGFKPPTMTWGMAASLTEAGNDASIAKRLAAYYGLPNDYRLTQPLDAPPEEVVDRFLAASGGTTDQLFPYLDGLCMWASFAARGIAGVIRGDEGFGWIPVKTAAHARSSVGLVILEDFLDQDEAEAISDGRQHLPTDLHRRSEESIPAYRDRLYHAFRIPVGLAALNDVKAPFVEIASPLLTREVLSFVRRMPDHLRTDKRAFRQIAKALSPPLPYATMGADDDRSGYLASEPYQRWFRDELESPAVAALLPGSWRARLQAGLGRSSHAPWSSRTVRAALKRVIPTAWVRAVRAQLGPEVPSRGLLTLRTALVSRMVRLLETDAHTLSRPSR